MPEPHTLGARAVRALRRAARQARRVRAVLTPRHAEASEEAGAVMSAEEVIAWRRRVTPTRRARR